MQLTSPKSRNRATNVVVALAWSIGPRGDDTYDGHVWVADDNGDEVGTVYGPMAPAAAIRLGERIAHDRRLELNVERS